MSAGPPLRPYGATLQPSQHQRQPLSCHKDNRKEPSPYHNYSGSFRLILGLEKTKSGSDRKWPDMMTPPDTCWNTVRSLVKEARILSASLCGTPCPMLRVVAHGWQVKSTTLQRPAFYIRHVRTPVR